MTAPTRPRPDFEPRSEQRSRRCARSTALGLSVLGVLGAAVASAQAQSVPANSAAPALSAASSIASPTTTKPRVDGAIATARVLANGSLRFTAPPGSVRPRTTRAKARNVADKVVPPSAAGRATEAFFALFSASSPARRAADGTVVPVFDRRPVWVVRYAGVKGERQTGVIVRRAGTTREPTTTLSLTVRTDIVVVIDDATASEVLRSEYAS